MQGGGLPEHASLPEIEICIVEDCHNGQYRLFSYCLGHTAYRMALLKELEDMGLFEMDKFKAMRRIAESKVFEGLN